MAAERTGVATVEAEEEAPQEGLTVAASEASMVAERRVELREAEMVVEVAAEVETVVVAMVEAGEARPRSCSCRPGTWCTDSDLSECCGCPHSTASCRGRCMRGQLGRCGSRDRRCTLLRC